MSNEYPMPDNWEPYTKASVVDLITAGANHQFSYTVVAKESGIAGGIEYSKQYVEKFSNPEHFKFFVKDGDKIASGDTILTVNSEYNSGGKLMHVVLGNIVAFTTIASGIKAPTLGNIARRGRAIAKYVGNRSLIFAHNSFWDFVGNVYIGNALKAGFGDNIQFTTMFDNAMITRDKGTIFRSICRGFLKNCEDKWDWSLYDKIVEDYKSKEYPIIPEFYDYKSFVNRDNVFADCDGVLLYSWTIADLVAFRAEYPNKKLYIGYYNDQPSLRKLWAYEFANKVSLYDGLVVLELFKTFKFGW